MSLGFVIWGTENGLNSNIVGHKVNAEIVEGLKAWDNAIRVMAQRVNSHFFSIHRLANFRVFSMIDPSLKDALGREGYLGCSVFFEGNHSYKDVLGILRELNELYSAKAAKNLKPTEQECSMILLKSASSPKEHLSNVKFNGKFILSGLQLSDVSKLFTNAILGFDPITAFIFSTDLSNNGIQIEGFNPLSYSTLVEEHNRVTKELMEKGDKVKRSLEHMAIQLRMAEDMTHKSGDQKQIIELLSSLERSDSHAFQELFLRAEFHDLKLWYANALQSQKRIDFQLAVTAAGQKLPKILSLLEDGRLDEAERILNSIPFEVRNHLLELMKVEKEIKEIRSSFFYRALKSKRQEDKGIKFLFWSIFGMLGLILVIGLGIGLRSYIVPPPPPPASSPTAVDRSSIIRDSLCNIVKIELTKADGRILLKDLYKIAGKEIPVKYESLKGASAIFWDDSRKCYLLQNKPTPNKHIPLALAKSIFDVIEGSTLKDIFKIRPFKSTQQLLDQGIFLKYGEWYIVTVKSSSKTVKGNKVEVKELYLRKEDDSERNSSKLDITNKAFKINLEAELEGPSEIKLLSELISPKLEVNQDPNAPANGATKEKIPGSNSSENPNQNGTGNGGDNNSTPTGVVMSKIEAMIKKRELDKPFKKEKLKEVAGFKDLSPKQMKEVTEKCKEKKYIID